MAKPQPWYKVSGSPVALVALLLGYVSLLSPDKVTERPEPAPVRRPRRHAADTKSGPAASTWTFSNQLAWRLNA